MKNNADYVIKKLTKINFPMPRKNMTTKQLGIINNQIMEIEESLKIFKDSISRFKIKDV